MSASITQPLVMDPAATAGSAATAPATDPNALTKTDIWSIVTTVAIAVALVILAYISAGKGWWIGIAAAVGALGGLVHEMAQSGGKILFFERKADGFYIGAIAGAVLGAVAGLMTIHGLLVDGGIPPGGATQLVYEALIAGMALKGVTEAAGGQAMPQGSKSLTAGEAMALEATANAMASDGPAKPVAPPALGPLPDALMKPLDALPDALPADI
jgi:hypothetical protein